jgi:hypothetical protein
MKTGTRQQPTLSARRVAVLVAILAGLLTSGFAIASDFTSDKWIGSLRSAQGRIMMDRGGREIFGRTGMRLFRKDVIHTTDNASVAVVFRDETSISLGPNSNLSLDDFTYDPENKKFGLKTGVTRGVAVFVAGAVATSDPESFSVTTPKGVIGIRGTKFTVKVEE